METRALSIPHSFVFTPVLHTDERGVFLETYRHESVRAAVGHALELRQANTSVSSKGVVRGIHYALVPPGQAKYVTVPSGAILDFVVDLRVGSPAFGEWDSVILDDVDRRALYIAEGLGHAFVALTATTTVSYFVSEVYDGPRELGVDPLDPSLGLDYSQLDGVPVLSDRDAAAPGLDEALANGHLPTWQDCLDLYGRLAG